MKRVLALCLGLLAGVGGCLAAVNLNTASVAELDAIKGVGPGKAKAIVAYREQNGPFKSVDDLRHVKGFGEKSVTKLRAELTVGESAAASSKKPAGK